MPSLRVLIADDSPVFTEAVARLLESWAGIEVVGRATNGREVLERVALDRPDLVLMDVAMPEMNGLEATRRLKAGANPPRIVVVTVRADPPYGPAARAAGADGFLSKSDLARDLRPLIAGWVLEAGGPSAEV